MCPNVNFGYDNQIFFPPAPAIRIELRSPEFPLSNNPEIVLALVDTGADGTFIPWSIINRLGLRLIDHVRVLGYDEKDSQMLPVFSIHLTVPGLRSVFARVIPKESDDYAIVGRDIINEWLLSLDGPSQLTRIQI